MSEYEQKYSNYKPLINLVVEHVYANFCAAYSLQQPCDPDSVAELVNCACQATELQLDVCSEYSGKHPERYTRIIPIDIACELNNKRYFSEVKK